MYGALLSSPIYTGFIVAILLNSSLLAVSITQVCRPLPPCPRASAPPP